ncbi:NAD-dependent epimerase/dehydratase family protein [Burkholderia vietnamiensis]|uniref:NAD-dependent epimerase/dehydratase family protein n=1 Tax=Burkholderia vietnamiensis TaxID=60552 RepID=UPI00265134CB|nr:NAD-dependent epimerase/dehydratase family protein [Burkholderia vietnamiensis]MDN8037077.1 NAD-dependent epimerase/dehydratase family protein [Burkholderia vietnamiensis]
MTHILITGAAGFVGSLLSKRVVAEALSTRTRVTLLDMSVAQVSAPNTRVIQGSLSDERVLAEALAGGVDTVYHLASVPGGTAEREPQLGSSVNLYGTLKLIDMCAAQALAPRFVFASSIAVYGGSFPTPMDEAISPKPATSYGAHKLIAEIALADAIRRGKLTGCSLRLPGVVARPPGPSGLISAFMSDIFWALRDGRKIALPVSSEAVSWWISRERCVDNLLFAGTTDVSALRAPTYQMPVLRLCIREILDALAAQFQIDWKDFVTFEPVSRVEALFGSYPVLKTPEAESAGFRNDGTIKELLARIFG